MAAASRASSEGYDIYQGQEDDTWLAIKDEVLVLSDNEETLENALKQRGEDDRLTEDDVERGVRGPAAGRAAQGVRERAARCSRRARTRRTRSRSSGSTTSRRSG